MPTPAGFFCASTLCTTIPGVVTLDVLVVSDSRVGRSLHRGEDRKGQKEAVGSHEGLTTARGLALDYSRDKREGINGRGTTARVNTMRVNTMRDLACVSG